MLDTVYIFSNNQNGNGKIIFIFGLGNQGDGNYRVGFQKCIFSLVVFHQTHSKHLDNDQWDTNIH